MLWSESLSCQSCSHLELALPMMGEEHERYWGDKTPGAPCGSLHMQLFGLTQILMNKSAEWKEEGRAITKNICAETGVEYNIIGYVRFTGNPKRWWGRRRDPKKEGHGQLMKNLEFHLKVLRLHPLELDDKYHFPQRRHPPWHKECVGGGAEKQLGDCLEWAVRNDEILWEGNWGGQWRWVLTRCETWLFSGMISLNTYDNPWRRVSFLLAMRRQVWKGYITYPITQPISNGARGLVHPTNSRPCSLNHGAKNWLMV